jgi:hypothetical protein
MSQLGERTAAVKSPRPRGPRSPARALLAGALRFVDAGPRPMFQAALASLAGTGGASIAIAIALGRAGRLVTAQREVITFGIAGMAVAGILALSTVIVPASARRAVLNRLMAPDQRAAIWLALAIWFPFLVTVAYYRIQAALPASQVWIAFGYLDKRWLTAAYLLGALAPMLLLVAAARVLAAGRAHPGTWRSWLRDLAPRDLAGTAADAEPPESTVAPGPAPQAVTAPGPALEAVTAAGPAPQAAAAAARRIRGTGFSRVTVRLLTPLGLACYFYGPPWYLSRTFGSVPISDQEDLYLGGLQAISKGAVPYIGPAAIQYGPGSQLIPYLLMRHVYAFSVVGFRESWATLQWAGASVLFVVFFLALGYVRGLAAALMSALIYPALQLMEFVPGGAYNGFFGWANPLRYAGAISLILLLPAVIRRAPAVRGLAAAGALGLLWGALSYVGQENLAAGAVGALVICALLLLTGTSSGRSVLTALLALLAGFLVAWLPVVAFYASKGLLGRFVYLYFLITRVVAEGYSNTTYGYAGLSPKASAAVASALWARMYYALPFALAVLALLAVVQLRPFRVAMEWSGDRIILVALLLTCILLYQGAMLRADADHLAGTQLVVPALAVTVATVLPRLLCTRRRLILMLAGTVLFAASFLLLPFQAVKFSSIGGHAAAPVLDRQRLAAQPVPATPRTLADQRLGPGLWAGPNCCGWQAEPMGEFITLMNLIHSIIGRRTTYVVSFLPGHSRVIYFVADLRPAPVPLDLHTMIFTASQRLAYLATFRKSVLPKTQALVTRHLGAAEAVYFHERYPHMKRISLEYDGAPLYVLLSR